MKTVLFLSRLAFNCLRLSEKWMASLAIFTLFFNFYPAAFASDGNDYFEIIINKANITVRNIPYTLHFSNGYLCRIDFNNSGHSLKVADLAFIDKLRGLFCRENLKATTDNVAPRIKKLILTSDRTVGKVKISFRKEYTFYLGSPLVKADNYFLQEPEIKWSLIRLNQLNMSKSFFNTWANSQDGVVRDIMYEEGAQGVNCYKDCKWCALYNPQDALGLISLDRKSKLLMYFHATGLYINGHFGAIDKKTLSVTNYWFFGANTGDCVGKAATKLASGIAPEMILQTENSDVLKEK